MTSDEQELTDLFRSHPGLATGLLKMGKHLAPLLEYGFGRLLAQVHDHEVKDVDVTERHRE